MATTELISFGLGKEWINRLWGVLKGRRERYRKDLEEINTSIGTPKAISGFPTTVFRSSVLQSCCWKIGSSIRSIRFL